MSIWCPMWDVSDDEHDVSCARMVKVGRDAYEIRRDVDCTCGAGPIAYQASHLNPEVEHGHAGSVCVSYIPDHVYGRRMPFLRVSVNDKDVIITHEQAVEMRDALSRWIGGDPTW